MPIIDHEVVAMEFDNENFQANMRETEESIKNFEHELSIIADKETLSEIGTVAIRVTENFEPLKTALDTIVETLMNNLIGAINKVKSAIDQVTVDPITQGFGKYEEKINAVQTIMNATGMTIEEVEERLDKLAWFTDETSYSFTEMTATLGKFTSAGVGLDDAMTSMIGIANWAGTAGVNAKTANRAFYNLAQAIGSGSIRLQDWASIENVNMNTADFQQTVIDTAKEMVTFGEVYDDLVKKYGANSQQLAEEVKKNGHTLEQAQTYMEYFAEGVSPKDVGWEGITSANFRGTLSSQWFTKSVFLETMKKYGDFTEQIYNFQNEAGIDTASEAMNTYAENFSDVMDKLYEAYTKFGKESSEFQAVVKENGISLQTALDFVSVKEAQLYNENLRSIADNLKKTADEFGIESDEFAKAAQEAGYSVSDGAEMVLNGIKKFEKAEKSRGEIGFRSAQEARTFTDAWGSAIEATASQWQAFWQKIFGNYEEAAVMWTDLANTLWDVFAGPIASLNEVMDTVIEMGARINIIGDDDSTYGIRKVWEELLRILEPIKQAFTDVFTIFRTDGNDELSTLANFIYNLTEKFKNWTESLNTSGKTLYEIRSIAQTFFGTIKAVGEILGSVFGNIGRVLRAFFPSFGELVSFMSELTSKLGNVENVGRSVSDRITSFTDKIVEKVLFLRAVLYIIFQALKEAIPIVIVAIIGAFTSVYNFISPYIEEILSFVPVVKEALLGVATVVYSIASTIVGNLIKIATSVINFLSTTFEIGGVLLSTATTAANSIFPFETLSKVISLLQPAFVVLLKVIGYIGDAIAKFVSNIDIAKAALITFAGAGALSATSLGMFLYDTFFNAINFLKGLLNPLTKFKDIFTGFLEVFKGAVESIFDNAWLEQVSKLVRSFAISVLILAGAALIFSAVDADNVAAAIGGMVGAITTLIGTVFALSKMSTTADAKGMLGITAVIVAFAAAIFTLSAAMLNIGATFSKYGLGGIISAIVGVIVATAALVVALKFFVDMTSEIEAFSGFSKKMSTIGKLLKSLAVSILIISFAVKIIGSMDPLQALQGFAAVILLMLAFGVFVKEMQKYTENVNKLVKVSAALVILAIAINMLVIPVELLGHMDLWQLIKGLGGIALILLEFYVFTKALISIDSKKLAKNLYSVAGAMVIFAIAINLLMIPIELMGHMKLDQLAKGIIGVGLLLAEFYIFDLLADKIKAGGLKLIAIATSALIMAFALSVMMIPVTVMANMRLEELAKGIGGIAVILLEIGLFAVAVDKFLGMGAPAKLLIISLAMLAISGSMIMFGNAVEKIGNMPIDGWIKGLVGIALILVEVIGFAVALQTFVKGGGITFILISVGMIALAYGLSKMVEVLEKVGNMDFGVLVKGLLGIAIVLAAMTGLAVLLSTFTPKLLWFSLGAAAVGAALYILGMGIDAVHTAFENIANDPYIREFADTLVEAIASGVDGAMTFLEDFGTKWNTFFEGLGGHIYDELHDENGNNKIGLAFKEFFGNIKFPDITQTEFYKTWSYGLDTMRSDISTWWTNLTTNWKNRFEGLKSATKLAWDDFCKTWKAGLDILTQPIKDFGKSWYNTFEGTGKEIFRIQKEYWEPGVQAIKNFFDDIGKVVKIFFETFIEDWKSGWDTWKTGFDDIWEKWKIGWEDIKNNITDKVTEITTNIKEAFDKWNTFFKGAGEEFYDLNSTGWNEIEDAIQGVVDKFNAFVETWKTGWNEIKGGWDEFWGNWGSGWNEIEAFFNKGKNEGEAEKEGYRESYGIHSPSEETKYEEQMKLEGRVEGASDPALRKDLEKVSEENAEIMEEPFEKMDLKQTLREKVYNWLDEATFLNDDQKNWIKEKFEAFAGGINFDNLGLPDINSLFENFKSGFDESQFSVDDFDLSKWEEQINNATDGVGDFANGVDGVDLSGLTNGLDASSLSAGNLSDNIAGLNDNLGETGDLTKSLSLSDIFGTGDLSTKAEAEGNAIGEGIGTGINTGITDATRKLSYNDIIHRNDIMRAAQKHGIWSDEFTKAIQAAGYTDDFYSTADRLKIYNEARKTRVDNFNNRINIKDSAELYRLITTLNDHGIMSDEFENALRSYYGDDYKDLTAKEKNDLVDSLTQAYANEEEFIANNYDAILRAYESGTGSASFKEFFNTSGSNDRDLNDFIDRVKASKYYNDKQLAESEKQTKDLGTMSQIFSAFNQVIDTDGVKVTMAKTQAGVLENALKVIESSTQKGGVKKNSLEYVQALDTLNWGYEDAEEYLKQKAKEEEEAKKKAAGTTTTQTKASATSSTSETKANTTSTNNPVTTVKADNVTVDTKGTTAMATTSSENVGNIVPYLQQGVEKLTSIDASITLMNTKIEQMGETITIISETALNELALLSGWKGELGAHNAFVDLSLANIQNKGVTIANRASFMREVTDTVDTALGEKATRRARGN